MSTSWDAVPKREPDADARRTMAQMEKIMECQRRAAEAPDLLRDKDALRAAMSRLSTYELGAVLGLALVQIAGNTNDLSGLLRDITDMIVGLEQEKNIEREGKS